MSRPPEVVDRKRPLATLRDAGDYMQAAFRTITHDEALFVVAAELRRRLDRES